MKRSLESRNNTDLALKLVFFSILALVAAVVVYELKMLIICLTLALTLASAMSPCVDAAEKRKIPRVVTVTAIYIAGIVAYVLLGALLVPAIREQWQKLNENLPVYLSVINVWYQKALNLTSTISDPSALNFEDIRNLFFRLLHHTLGMTAGLVGLILNALLTLFLAAYFVIESQAIWTALFKWMPRRARVIVAPLISPLIGRMGGYVRGQLLVALGAAIFLVVGFSMAGIKYALLLGTLAGLFNLIPYVGSLIACAFAVVVAFNQTPILVAVVLVIYGFEQWFESSFMVPFFVGKHANLHPLVVLVTIIIGASLMGVPGALISVPIASVATFLAEEFYIKRFVEDEQSSNSEDRSERPLTQVSAQ